MGCFSPIHLLLFCVFCLPFFFILWQRRLFFYLWGTWRALLVLGCKKGSNCRIPNKSNDWNWNMQGRDLLSLSGYGLSAFTSAVPYIQAQRLVVWIRPAIIHSVWASEWLWLWHKCHSKQSWPQWHHIYSFELLLLVAVGVIRHRSTADVFFFQLKTSVRPRRRKGEISPQRLRGKASFAELLDSFAILAIWLWGHYSATSPWQITQCKINMKKLTWKGPDPSATSATGIYHPIYHPVRMK